ncbi:unnamed protein product [Heligmosomoides polygyrus]|uniref:Helix-turn-helix domain-containing protein n=1 Tax=Heligmosomoides polygyrus TaxID=6339 RepID=A0A183FX67_HELPZ|nr:unnamed protein product [Heligmosomoides polygyrus]
MLVLGVDTCADALIGRNHQAAQGLDLLLADALSLPFRQAAANICAAFDEHAVTVYRWLKRFEDGVVPFESAPRSGRRSGMDDDVLRPALTLKEKPNATTRD